MLRGVAADITLGKWRTAGGDSSAVNERAWHADNGSMTYSDDELEFLKAIDQYKIDKRRKFPTNCEILAVLKSLGYKKG